MPKDARHWGRTRKGARAAVGVALALGATLLTGCGTDEGAAPTLTWYINPDAGGQAELAKQCTEASGGAYTIETSLLPNDAASQREQLARRLAAGDKSMDIMSLDPPNVPEYAEPGYLAPVPADVAERTTQGVLEGALAGAKWKDEVVAVPFWANTQILWYRKSVAQAAGLDMSKPVTWDQIIEAAKSQDKYIGVQGARAESMTVWVNALVESAGGTIVENPDAPADELKLGLDTEAGKQAAEVVSTIGKEGLGGPGLPTQTENTSMIQFQGDQGSFMVNYPFVWPATNASVEEGALPDTLIDDIGWTLYPAMTEGEETAPPLGGINLGVGSNSQHPDLAYQAIECIVSPENQAQYFATNGNPPSNEDAYNDPSVTETFPMAPTIRDSLELAKPRPQTPYYNEISTGIQQTWTPPSDVNPDSTPATSQEFIIEVLRGEKLL
ncbi:MULTISPECIES: extracellular solute-binding protein [unclassified Arthrobacter]|uniref:extracellular solute-binding protein n=1 Tax=unclassified Arthrobacter TaxID=235627 RepID=UPI001D14A009|nr:MULTISPECIES: extracellular solute-binding protein [unclassified Arthrobacter]MCC3275166.1 extracellular solute-binding protein [Arthrobacter sp. zg-Y20]MCC9176613.1 extracellular solute-binding protein [Arthrobacter sp. zg-Y750]MDK1315323.1 extracellular solute-binding protein [Arthrobacter sp. zg.Y20]WIB05745.1 extracellular solute-binding protein [Arthrobacter sp. zg-Y20]